MARRMTAAEFKNFLGLYKSERYGVIMSGLATGSRTWAQLKKTVEAEEGMTIGQGEITKLLSNLESQASARERGSSQTGTLRHAPNAVEGDGPAPTNSG